MKLPSTLMIGHQVYTIEEKNKEWFKDAERFGHCDFAGSTIAVVNTDMTNAHIINTLIHETLHAMWREYSLPPEPEEHIVTCLANGLTQMFRDNPELLKVLKKLS
jgi:hypothetical protein